MPFQIIRNDITKVRADAIVNTANPRPIYAGGTDAAVYLAAGPEALLAERRKIGRISPGEAAVTPAFALPAEYIIHTVGPVWEGGGRGEYDLLASCYRKSLLLARQLGCRSIAFPLISTGVYGFPRDKALEIALSEISAFLEDHPGVFEKAALCAPMIAPLHAGMPLAAGMALCVGAKLLGRGRERLPMSRPWAGPEEFETSCATGRERFDWFDDLRVRTERYHNNGPTFSWTLEAFRVTRRLLAPGKPESVSVPVRIYTAEDDNQVEPEAQEKMASRLPKGERKVVSGAKHEIYRSPDEVLFPWWREILAFLAE